MQIVIDIPEEQYEWIKEHKGVTDFQATEVIYNAARNAVVLPKGHGRLIDAGALCQKLKEVSGERRYDTLFSDNLLSVADVFNAIIADLKGTAITGYMNAPTIIEADKEVG